MSTIAERIIEVVDANGGNMSAFARKIDVTPAYISKLKNEPDRVPSDRTISDICKEFKVNEVWLRTGCGEPFCKMSVEEELSDIFANVLNGDPSTKSRLIRAFARLPEDAYPLIEQIIVKMAAELEDKNTE